MNHTRRYWFSFASRSKAAIRFVGTAMPPDVRKWLRPSGKTFCSSVFSARGQSKRSKQSAPAAGHSHHRTSGGEAVSRTHLVSRSSFELNRTQASVNQNGRHPSADGIDQVNGLCLSEIFFVDHSLPDQPLLQQLVSESSCQQS